MDYQIGLYITGDWSQSKVSEEIQRRTLHLSVIERLAIASLIRVYVDTIPTVLPGLLLNDKSITCRATEQKKQQQQQEDHDGPVTLT